MKILELYAGSRSLGKVAEELGHQVFSVDIHPFPGVDLVQDIEYLTLDQLPWIPQVIWASVPCTTYSIVGLRHHRPKGGPISEFSEKSDRLVKHTLALMEEAGAIWYLENPRGLLRKMPFMKGMPRATVTYCSYGDSNMKPTDIWTNNLAGLFNPEGWLPRPMCYNGNTKCHHEAAPRGSKTGIQGMPSAYHRSKLPAELCREVILAAERVLHIQAA